MQDAHLRSRFVQRIHADRSRLTRCASAVCQQFPSNRGVSSRHGKVLESGRAAFAHLGAGEGNCLCVAVGARDKSTGPDWGAYPVDEAAIRHGAGVEQETTKPEEAYARFPARERVRYREGWIPR